MLASNNYLTTFFRQVKQFETDPSRLESILTFQSLLFPLSAIASIVIGLLMQKKGLVISYFIMGVISLIFGALTIIQAYWIQYLTLLVYIFNRFFFIAMSPVVVIDLYGFAN